METQSRPPGAPRVLGILSIIFGAIVLVFSQFGLAARGIGADFASTRALKLAMAEYEREKCPNTTV